MAQDSTPPSACSKSTLKRCPRCGESKPLEAFPGNRKTKDGRYAYCKDCTNAKAREWRERHPGHWQRYIEKKGEAKNARRRERRKDPRYRLAQTVKAYGITLEDYDRMMSAQGGRCAICKEEPGDVLLQVDHCHATGKVRGLLCGRCNRAISQLGDDAERACSAAIYLLRSYEIDVHFDEEDFLQ